MTDDSSEEMTLVGEIIVPLGADFVVSPDFHHYEEKGQSLDWMWEEGPFRQQEIGTLILE